MYEILLLENDPTRKTALLLFKNVIFLEKFSDKKII